MPDRPVEASVENAIKEKIIEELLHQGLNDEQLRAFRMKKAGAAKIEIAKHSGVSVTTVGNWLGKARRIITRSQRED